MDFVLDQISRNRKTFSTGLNTTHVDEAWFCLIRDREKVRVFPGEEKVGSTKVQRKSGIPKVMSISALSRPDRSHNFDVIVGIWRVCVSKGEEYEFDSE